MQVSVDKELIRVVDLHKSFGDLHVLQGVTEQISKGEVVSVIGPSGGGKSRDFGAGRPCQERGGG